MKIPSFLSNLLGYKLCDAKLSYSYLLNNRDIIITIEEITTNCGGESLRVDAIIFEFEQNGVIKVTDSGFFANPLSCRFKR